MSLLEFGDRGIDLDTECKNTWSYLEFLQSLLDVLITQISSSLRSIFLVTMWWEMFTTRNQWMLTLCLCLSVCIKHTCIHTHIHKYWHIQYMLSITL
jgi:hypothetical protein